MPRSRKTASINLTHRGRKSPLCPAGATRCTDSREI